MYRRESVAQVCREWVGMMGEEVGVGAWMGEWVVIDSTVLLGGQVGRFGLAISWVSGGGHAWAKKRAEERVIGKKMIAMHCMYKWQ